MTEGNIGDESVQRMLGNDLKTTAESGDEKCEALIIDNSRLFQRMMRDQLKNLGLHSITNAESGLLGVDLARRLDPKLIIMDHNLPDMDGLQCLQLIREDNAEVKIIICSGNLTSDTMRKYILLGANHILTKPVSTSALADAVKRLIR
jgi:CheY-like chemotaxis protein